MNKLIKPINIIFINSSPRDVRELNPSGIQKVGTDLLPIVITRKKGDIYLYLYILTREESFICVWKLPTSFLLWASGKSGYEVRFVFAVDRSTLLREKKQQNLLQPHWLA